MAMENVPLTVDLPVRTFIDQGFYIAVFDWQGVNLHFPGWLVVNLFFSYIENVIIPTDFHIFQRGWLNHQPAGLSHQLTGCFSASPRCDAAVKALETFVPAHR